MFSILFLIFLIIIIYNFQKIRHERVVVRKVVDFLMIAINSVEEESRLIAKKTGVVFDENQKSIIVLEKVKIFLKVLGFVTTEDKLNILKIIVKVYKTKADFKKKTTEVVYHLLTSRYSNLNEEQAYNITYIVNRFLKEVFESPLAAASNFLFRFYKFLKKFHY